MRAKSVVWMMGLLPLLEGCGALHSLTTETREALCACSLGNSRRQSARTAWQHIREQNPGSRYSNEFHDGFIDGYGDCLACTEESSLTTLFPFSSTRNSKYFSADGQCLDRDYSLGFKYGFDVATANSRQDTLPVPRPQAGGSYSPEKVANRTTWQISPTVPRVSRQESVSTSSTKPPIAPQPKKKPADDLPEREPLLATSSSKANGESPKKPIPPLPKPEIPVIKPFNPTLPSGKFAPISVPPDSDQLPAPQPPLPIPGSRIEPIPVPPTEPQPPIPSGPSIELPPPPLKVGLPAPSNVAPALPTTPASILNEIPVIPFHHTLPAGTTPPATIPAGK